jgi:hypothetical protein
MTPTFNGKNAKIKVNMSTRGEVGYLSCGLVAEIDARRLCKYSQMYVGVHTTGEIHGGKHIVKDLPIPNLFEEVRNIY